MHNMAQTFKQFKKCNVIKLRQTNLTINKALHQVWTLVNEYLTFFTKNIVIYSQYLHRLLIITKLFPQAFLSI